MKILRLGSLKRKKRVLVLSIIPVTIAVISVVVWIYLLELSAEKILSKMLSDVVVSNIQYKSKKYAVRNGRVVPSINIFDSVKILRLAAFYQWNKEDPLYYSPDINPTQFNLAVEKVDKAQKELLSALKMEDRVYPTEFLYSFGKTASLTHEFMKNPSQTSAEIMLSMQLQTVDKYDNEVNRMLSILRSIRKNNKKISNYNSTVLFNVSLTPDTVISNFESLNENSIAMQKEIHERKMCYEGKGICKRPSQFFRKPQNEFTGIPLKKSKFLDSKMVFATAEDFEPNQIKGIFRAKTPCYGWGENFSSPEDYYYLREFENMLTVRPATEIYFRKLLPIPDVSARRKMFMDHIPYAFEDSSILYMCSNHDHLVQISEMYYFLNNSDPILSQEGIIDNSTLDPLFAQKAEEYEKKIFEADHLSYDELSVLADYYVYIYKHIVSQDSNSAENIKLKDELLKRKLMIQNKLGLFYKILNFSALAIEETEELGYKNHPKEYVEIIMYYYRNFYGVMYMPFSPAIYRNDEPPVYLDRRYVEDAIGLDGIRMSYSQAKTKYSAREIQRFLDIPK